MRKDKTDDEAEDPEAESQEPEATTSGPQVESGPECNADSPDETEPRQYELRLRDSATPHNQCTTPGCTRVNNHDGAHSNELTRWDITGPPSRRLRAEKGPPLAENGGAFQKEKGKPDKPNKPSKPRYLVPCTHWPDYRCLEHGGRGWEVTIKQKRGAWVKCEFMHATDNNGSRFADVWRKKKKFD